MSESCSSRHFSWLTKSCFPNPQHHHHLNQPQPHHTALLHRHTHKSQPQNPHHHQSSLSSLPEDLLLECLSRVPHSALSSIPLVCRRWAHLLDSSAFHDLRRLHGRLRRTLFAVAVTESGLHTASHRIGHDSSWKTASFLPQDDFVFSPGMFHALFSHSRLLAIDRKIYIIGRTAMIRCDTWTGTVGPKSAMIFPRKKFAASVVAGKIYVAGGATRTSAVEEYDPCSDSWRVVSDAPRRRYGCIGTSVDGVFYVIGGLKIGSSGDETSRASGAEARVYASSMDLYDVAAGGWLRSRAVPGGGCVVAACAAEGHVYVLTSHAVELSFWRFNARRAPRGTSGGGFGEWRRMKSPPLPAQVRFDSTVRFSCVGVEDKVVVVQVMGCIDDLLRRGGRSTRGVKEALVLVYDTAAGEWSRGPDLPEVIRRAACVCVEC
ncbi:F-box/kelch-repeat protein [Actinidia chinensis var. chinensis]|uniref:F-box/kelch-repeat protein n=1 Tax=Actinidia chinensis var. chinensis TaxID=1590841 RepID=A0A2R6P813_ACTCC|nr:F-box/kelch-repeat protein [Actinidia chinensis var. chinensis]